MLARDVLDYLKSKLAVFPQKDLCRIPTPCHRLMRISEIYGCDVYCKREDLTGFGMGGNKTRKLAFLIPEALAHNCDTLVTSGGIQSNFCRVTAAAGAVNGMSVHLVLGGVRPKVLSGNLILDDILGANIHYVNSSSWDHWEDESETLCSSLRAEGKNVFRIPIGGSVPVGAMGYVKAFLEILDHEISLGFPFDEIFHASGSGGTQAGLIAGKALSGWTGNIQGISVALKKEELEKDVYGLSRETAGLLGGIVDQKMVVIDDRYIGIGYGIPTPETHQTIQYFSRHEGIFLDPVYTAKAAYGLLTWLEQNKNSKRKILFIHTGGQPALFS